MVVKLNEQTGYQYYIISIPAHHLLLPQPTQEFIANVIENLGDGNISYYASIPYVLGHYQGFEPFGSFEMVDFHISIFGDLYDIEHDAMATPAVLKTYLEKATLRVCSISAFSNFGIATVAVSIVEDEM